jgi:hypothetical protein
MTSTMRVALLFLLAAALSGQVPKTSPHDDSAREAVILKELKVWWEASYPPPKKPAKSPDDRWAEHKRSILKGFSVHGDTVTVMTNLTRNSTYNLNNFDKRDAQDLCHELGPFLWEKKHRVWGLNNIRIVGAGGELLSYRNGLAGKVQ